MSKDNINLEIVYGQGKQLVDFYRNNPCIAAYDLLSVDLAPIQQLVFEDMWFRSFVIGVCSRGFGKSVSVDGLVLSENGLVYLKEILPPIPSFLNPGETIEIDNSESLFTAHGERKSKRVSLEKEISGLKLITDNGFEHKGSNHHPLLILNNKTEFEYKMLADFKEGDYVCIQRGQDVFGTNNINHRDSYLIGLLTSCGGIINDNNFISVTTAYEQIVNFCVKYCYDNSVSFELNRDERTGSTEIVFKEFQWFFDSYGIDWGLSCDKSVPLSVRTADKISQTDFLKGYFDGAGVVHNNGVVSCCSTSAKLIKEVQLMLLNFGIVAIFRSVGIADVVYELSMPSYDSLWFRDIIGFNLVKKQELLGACITGGELKHVEDVIPFFDGREGITYRELYNIKPTLSGDLLKRADMILSAYFYFDTVKSVEPWSGDCYDFQMDMMEEPNYFANGFINHNTFLLGTLSALSCLLYPGYRVGLIAPVFRQSVISGTYDTFWTSDGLQTTTQTFYDSIQEGVTKTQSLKYQNTILSKWKNPERACRSIKTTKGFELAGTVDHGILVLNKELGLVYKELQDIDRMDNIVIKKGFKYFGDDDSMPTFDGFKSDLRTKDCKIPEKLTPDLAYFFGLIIGDGCVSVSKDKRKRRVDFVNEDQDLLDCFENYLREYFCVDKDEKISRRNRKNNTWEIEYNSKKLVNYLLKCGFTKTTALDKKIPAIIKKASQECIKQFLIGLIDTDGCVYIQKNKGCEVSLNTSSLQLAKEVQACFLNFGIMSNLGISSKAQIKQLPQGNKPSKCAEAYKVRITGLPDLFKYRDEIGFRCARKAEKLNNYLANVSGKTSSADKIPNTAPVVKELAVLCKNKVEYGSKDVVVLRDITRSIRNSKNIKKEKIETVLSMADKYEVRTEGYYKLKSLLKLDLCFVNMKESDYFFAETIDAEVENESCYWSNGFISHNSKMIFSEVERLYARSSILREASEKRPTRGSDSCYLKFKSVGGVSPSFIEALPLADGSKIRGSRFYLIVVDELAQVPDKTLDMVVRPMGATTLEPMENVRKTEKQQKLIEIGLATDDDFEESTVNKMIMTSSGYYKFNHMWRRMKDYWGQMAKAEKENKVSQYKVWQVPYWDLPMGFLDENNIKEAKRIMSNSEYHMEYEADMISDSEGFFKASLLEECTTNSNFSIELSGVSNSKYIIGVDPNQGGSDSCGIVLIKIGDIHRIVNVIELKSKTTQDITLAVQRLSKAYNVLRIFMDKGGGGKAVMDLLEEGYNDENPILSRDNEDNKQKKGRHILDMINFAPIWISDANFTTLSLLEDKRLLFPEPPTTVSDLEGKAYENVNVLKSQMRNIIVTQTSSGNLHFDTPKKGQRKDLYSATILAAYGVRAIEKELEQDGPTILYNTSGMVRQHNNINNAGWGTLNATGPPIVIPDSGLNAASLSGKRRIKVKK